MEISAGWVEAISAVIAISVTLAGTWLRSTFAARDLRFESLTSATKNLYEKHDHDVAKLNEYKLHVAETYVNLPALEKIFAPLNRRLENIESELRGARDDR